MSLTIIGVACVCLYSTGHWIGATLLLAWFLVGLWEYVNDPTGMKRYLRMLRS